MSRKKDNSYKQIKKRAYTLFFVTLMIYSFLLYKLTRIQIIDADKYKARVENQNYRTVNLNSGRGTIYDRNGEPLTDVIEEEIMIVEKDKFMNDASTKELVFKYSVEDIKGVNKEIQNQMQSNIFEIKVKDLTQKEEEELLKNEIIVAQRTLRNTEENILSHTIGSIKEDDNTGISGIEKAQEELLNGSNEQYVSVFKAGQSGNTEDLNLLKGSVDEVYNNSDAEHLKITIDKEIQTKIENLVDKEENPTAVVISDVNTGEVLAMSSRPNFDQDNIAPHFDSKEGELINKSIQSTYAPGSVFKIVVLYAGLNEGIIDENYLYNCTGKVQVGKDEYLDCNNKEGHGMQSLQHAFSNSCNTAFFDIGQKVGEDKIIEAATELHLNEPVDIGLVEEKYNEIPTGVSMRNLCIGQGSLAFTPIQINQMTQIIANNGTYKPLYIYDSIINNEKEMIKSFKTSKEEEIISPYTITIIKEMMKEVSKEGTGKDLEDLDGGCGVKTGTAQTSRNGEKVNDGWVTGFYPEESPKYAITVLVEGTKDNNKSAIPLFKEICQSLTK